MTFAAILFFCAGGLFIAGLYATLLIKNIWIGPMGMLSAFFLIILSIWVWALGPAIGVIPALIIGSVLTAAIVLFVLKVISDDLEWAARN